MWIRRTIPAWLLCAVLTVASCATGDFPTGTITLTRTTAPAATVPLPEADPMLLAAGERAAAARTRAAFAWLEGLALRRWFAALDANKLTAYVQAVRAARRVTPSPAAPSPTAKPSTPPGGPGQCGGHFPPCGVRQRESGGSYAAINPNGCGGDGCYGAWQFKQTTWDAVARRMGRSDLVGRRASDCSPEDQDAVAANLWADGDGASNWAQTLG